MGSALCAAAESDALDIVVKPAEVKKEKKVRVSKWKVEHSKVVADVEPMLATIKAFDCNRLYWLAQHMAQQKRKCLDLDSTAQASLNCYSKWICQTRNAGKLSRDVSSDIVESEEESEEEEEEEEEEDDDVGYKKLDLSKMCVRERVSVSGS